MTREDETATKTENDDGPTTTAIAARPCKPDDPPAEDQLARIIQQHENLLLQLKLQKEMQGRTKAQDRGDTIQGKVFDRSGSYDPQSELGKRIDQFLARTEKVPSPMDLTGPRNYLAWREDILVNAERVKVQSILRNEEEDSPSECPNESLFWDEQDNWLYFYIWDSLSLHVKSVIKRPHKRSAFLLWTLLEAKFRMSDSLVQADLISTIIPDKASITEYKDDLEYLKEFQKMFTRLDKLHSPHPPAENIVEVLKKGLSQKVSKYLERIIKKNPEFFKTFDTVRVINELSFYLSSPSIAVQIEYPSSDNEPTFEEAEPRPQKYPNPAPQREKRKLQHIN